MNIQSIQQQAVKMSEQYMRGIFEIPENLPYTAEEFALLGKLADLYFCFKRGEMSRAETIKEQSRLLKAVRS